jgi:transposase
MGRARALEEFRIMRFEELLDRRERGHLTQAEAGEMLGMSERTFRRWQARYREDGAAGLRDRRIGQPSPRRAPASELARAQGRLMRRCTAASR